MEKKTFSFLGNFVFISVTYIIHSLRFLSKQQQKFTCEFLLKSYHCDIFQNCFDGSNDDYTNLYVPSPLKRSKQYKIKNLHFQNTTWNADYYYFIVPLPSVLIQWWVVNSVLT